MRNKTSLEDIIRIAISNHDAKKSDLASYLKEAVQDYASQKFLIATLKHKNNCITQCLLNLFKEIFE